MDEDFMFNLEDINISQESLDFISESANSGVEDRIVSNKQQQITPGEEDMTSIELDESKPAATENNNNVELEKQEGKEAEQSSQEGTPSPENSSHDSTLYALAQYLKGEGVLFIEEDLKEVKSLADLKDLIKTSNEKARYANLNEAQRRYQESLENGIPKSVFEEVEKEIQTFTGIKEEDVVANPNLRYEIIAIDLMNQGIDQNKAMKLAKLSLADETNIQDAKDALSNIIANKKAKFEDLKSTSTSQKAVQLDDFKKSIFSKEIILDQKLNDQTKNKLFDLITTKVDSDEEGRPLNELQKWQRDNPVESSIMLNYLFMMTEKGKNMKLINQSSTTTASKELERKLQSMSFAADGSLIIPDQLTQAKSTQQPNKNNLTINI